MASKELSILLTAKNMASGPIGKVTKDVSTLGAVAGHAGKGISTLGRNVMIAGAAVAGGFAIAVKGGIASLASLESATSSVTGAINQVGLKGKVTGAQVANWANEIEASVQAAFDDKDIIAATTTLVRFGKVSASNLRPAMVVMTDLATKTGDVGSAAALLGKALAAPDKAAGKLQKAGVLLTAEQQKQIKVFMKHGQLAKAQEVILKSLAKTTAGAAVAWADVAVDETDAAYRYRRVMEKAFAAE